MKIFIACSKHFYNEISGIKQELESNGHEITLPNSYENHLKEEELKKQGPESHIKWKANMLRRDKTNIQPNDAVLVLNLKKNNQQNYIGGATFLEIYKAWEMNKKIFLCNPIPENIFKDELTAMQPIIIDQDLSLIRQNDTTSN
jgi:hypothetical protein